MENTEELSVADKLRKLARELCPAGDDRINYALDEILGEHPELELVGKPGMIVMPDHLHMTEEMIDATRPVHMLYETRRGGASNEDMLRHLAMGWPWTLKYVPDWMKTDKSHLTKAGRAILCHALTVAAWKDPKFSEMPGEEFIEQFEEPKVKAKIERVAKKGENVRLAWINKLVVGILPPTGYRPFDLKVDLHPMVSLIQAEGPVVVSFPIVRADVPKDVRHLVRRTGTKLIFSVKSTGEVVAGPTIYNDRQGGRPEVSELKCVSIAVRDSLKDFQLIISRRGDNNAQDQHDSGGQ